jgi:hypothetical protein
MQSAPHALEPSLHWQVPETHDCVDGQSVFPQQPSSATQVPAQSRLGGKHSVGPPPLPDDPPISVSVPATPLEPPVGCVDPPVPAEASLPACADGLPLSAPSEPAPPVAKTRSWPQSTMARSINNQRLNPGGATSSTLLDYPSGRDSGCSKKAAQWARAPAALRRHLSWWRSRQRLVLERARRAMRRGRPSAPLRKVPAVSGRPASQSWSSVRPEGAQNCFTKFQTSSGIHDLFGLAASVGAGV